MQTSVRTELRNVCALTSGTLNGSLILSSVHIIRRELRMKFSKDSWPIEKIAFFLSLIVCAVVLASVWWPK